MKIKKLSLDAIFSLLLAFFVIRCTGSYIYIYIPMFLWIFLAALKHPQRFVNIFRRKNNSALLIFLLYILVICSTFGTFQNGIGNTVRYLGLFVGAIVLEYYQYEYSTLKTLVGFSAAIWGYYILKSLRFYFDNPGAARLIMSHQGEQYANVAVGGGYGLAFGCALIAVYLFGLFLTEKKEWKLSIRLILIFSIIVMVMLCLKVESTITLLALILGLFIDFSLYLMSKIGKKSRQNTVIIIFIMIIVLMLIVMFDGQIGTLLANSSITGNKVIDSRIQEIGMTLAGNQMVGDVQLRYNVYIKSLYTMFTRPLFGSIASYGFGTRIGVSGHSELLDVFALYGWPCGIAFFLWYKRNIHFQTRKYALNEGYYFVAWVLLVANQFTYWSSAWALFFIVPAVQTLYFNRDNTEMEGNERK